MSGSIRREWIEVHMNTLVVQVHNLCEQAVTIWMSGGWAMVALAVNALVLFGLGMHVFLKLNAKGFQAIPEKTWRRWINCPGERKGPIGEMINFVTGAASLKETARLFRDLHDSEIIPFERDLRVMKVCVSAAPLLGLLGTVTGMLATFGALSAGSGGEKTMGLVAQGISEALITTETGLVIALPGLFFQYQLSRKHQRYKSFLAHLETICNQMLHRTIRGKSIVAGPSASMAEA
ncbi:MAG: MotA/TolQ/ExbB proton channel family protein [Candidatus Omnitrophica bacterium]|nr:MotA/TolQ/ExbB proton channel family protein [Candidatus Omnitrophota bacterium]